MYFNYANVVYFQENETDNSYMYFIKNERFLIAMHWAIMVLRVLEDKKSRFIDMIYSAKN